MIMETDRHNNAPIGIFDSGLGGLTVVKSVSKLLPDESVIYIGDTARIPYGPKSPQVVKRFSVEIGSYLVKLGVKAVVIACNTASSFGLSTLTSILPVPVLGVVGPGAKEAVNATKNGRIGVIGTRGTISSEAYQSAILAIKPDARVFAAPAPLFVPLVEEGHLNDELVRLAVKLYIEPLMKKEIDTLVLGCTHYPLLKETISNYVGSGITIVDSASASAEALKNLIVEKKLTTSGGLKRKVFYCTDNPEGFRTQGMRFLGAGLENVQLIPLSELSINECEYNE